MTVGTRGVKLFPPRYTYTHIIIIYLYSCMLYVNIYYVLYERIRVNIVIYTYKSYGGK